MRPARSMPLTPRLHARARRRLLLAALAALAGCSSVRPDQLTPAVAVPDRWSHTASAHEPSPRSLSVWWNDFNDPVLSQVIERTVQETPQMRAALAKLTAARAARALARAQLSPTVSGSASAQSAASGSRAFSDAFNVGLDAAWELDLFGAKRWADDAAAADLQSARAIFEATRVSLAAEAALVYIELRTLQSRLEFSARALRSQSELFDLVQARTQAGLASELELLQARAALEQTQAQSVALHAALSQVRTRLALLQGQQLSELDPRLDRPAPIPMAPERVAVGIPAAVLAQRPDVLAAEHALAGETARVGAAQAARFPSFSLRASLGLSAPTPSGLLGPGSTAQSLMAGLTTTLFDAGRLRQQVEIRSAAQAQALAQYESTMLTALAEVEDALRALQLSLRRDQDLRAAAQTAHQASALSHHRFTAGLADFQQVLEALRTEMTTSDAAATGRAQIAESLVRLYKALGGGWSSTQEPSGVSR